MTNMKTVGENSTSLQYCYCLVLPFCLISFQKLPAIQTVVPGTTPPSLGPSVSYVPQTRTNTQFTAGTCTRNSVSKIFSDHSGFRFCIMFS